VCFDAAEAAEEKAEAARWSGLTVVMNDHHEDPAEPEEPKGQPLASVPDRDPRAPAYFCGAKAPWSPVVRFCTLLPGDFPEGPHAAIGNRYVVRRFRTVAVSAPVWWDDSGWLAHPDNTAGRA
jgi:hypothetical protein